jgi:hypothetical protein
MNQTKVDQFKDLLIARATELGMDVQHRNTCSPGIKALAQMHAIVLRRPHLLQAFENDLLVHDLGLLSSPDAPERFVWTIRPSGTTVFFPDAGADRNFLDFMKISTGSVAFTFDGDKLEEVLNPSHAAHFLAELEEVGMTA